VDHPLDPTSPSSFKPRRGPKNKYPWDEWQDGEWHIARYSHEFGCEPHSFTSQLHLRARRAGGHVETTTVGGTVTFKFHLPAETQKEAGTNGQGSR
jgi:hypothetical protein